MLEGLSMSTFPPAVLRRHSALARPHARGFTLIELMIVVTLMAVMLGIAAPSFRDFMAGQRVKTAAGEYASTLVQARSEAIKRNTSVTVTPATLSASGWAQGWTVAAGGTTLVTQDSYTGLTFAGSATAITYLGTGRLSAAATTMKVTADHADSCMNVAIDLSGMPRSTKTAKSGGVCP